MRFSTTSALSTTLPFAAAWPNVMEMNRQMQKREEPPPHDPVFKSGRQILDYQLWVSMLKNSLSVWALVVAMNFNLLVEVTFMGSAPV
ncbi:peroxidase [Ascochyta rabiei]|uniref:Peroxidase n=1 Tax=Didymella rabiei TaxID=5454 RepID=A0A163LFP3_DIDRA|nr:peroxidase [Ascochyta rabiei]